MRVDWTLDSATGVDFSGATMTWSREEGALLSLKCAVSWNALF